MDTHLLVNAILAQALIAVSTEKEVVYFLYPSISANRFDWMQGWFIYHLFDVIWEEFLNIFAFFHLIENVSMWEMFENTCHNVHLLR